ncbi:hypothetical protein [Rubritalea tangerina]
MPTSTFPPRGDENPSAATQGPRFECHSVHHAASLSNAEEHC